MNRSQRWTSALLVALLALAAACGQDGGDPTPADTHGGDADAAPTPDGAADAEPDAPPAPDADAWEPDGDADEHGFYLRKPAEHAIECPVMANFAANDSDWVCTFEHGGVSGLVYIQATPTACDSMELPVYGQARGWMSVDGVAAALDAAGYDFGGNHHNDFLDFTRAGQAYRYYHSSFGYGWRQCHEMDCLQVLGAGGSGVDEDGCTADRTLPIVCRQVQPDGTYGELVDTFEPCPGDPNHP